LFMASRLVTVATFPSVALAALARNLLTDAGIASEVTEGNTSWAFAGLLGEVKLIVAEEDAERAGQILDEQARLFGDEPHELEMEPARAGDDPSAEEDDDFQPADYSPGIDEPAWVCPSCGVRVNEDAPRCWSCGTSKRGEINPYFARPLERVPDVAPEKRTEVPADEVDDLVTRAWRASMFGIILLPPLVTFYSAWLLLRAAATGVKFDKRQSRRFVVALVINVMVAGVASLFWWELVGVPVFVE
jgi:Putative prokaryotic signal transducing protein